MTRIVLRIPGQPNIEFEMELGFMTTLERPEAIVARALDELAKHNPQAGITQNDILIGRLEDNQTFKVVSLTGEEKVIHLQLTRAPAPVPVPLISSQDFIALYSCLAGFYQPGKTHFVLTSKKSPDQMMLSTYATHTVFFDDSLFQKKFHDTEKIINTYGDGNCAFNAASTGIADLLLLGQLDCQHELIQTLYQSLLKRNPPLNPSDVLQGLQQWLRTLLKAGADVPADQVIAQADAACLNEMQRQMQPVVRNYVMTWIDIHRGAKSYVEAFLGSYNAFLNEKEDETFIVHSHIKAQFAQWQQASPPPPTDKECRTWWKEKGYPQYLNNLKQNALGSGDKERWGSEVEVGALGEILNINIFLKGRGFDKESMEGPGGGFIFDLSQVDRDKLQQLGLGYNNKDRPVFVLNPTITSAMIERAFQPSPYLEQVRVYFQTPAHRQTRLLPVAWTDPLLLQDLAARGVIDSKSHLWIGDETSPDTDRILDRLSGDRVLSPPLKAAAAATNPVLSSIQPPSGVDEKTLKDVVLKACRPGLPSFYAVHGGGHWEYKIPLKQREVLLVIDEVSKRIASMCDKFNALSSGKPIHVLLPLTMPDPIALCLEFNVSVDKQLTLKRVTVLDPNNDTEIRAQLVKWLPSLNKDQIIQIPVLGAKPQTALLHTLFNFICFAHFGKFLNHLLIRPTLPHLIPAEQCYLSETLLALLNVLKQYRNAGDQERPLLKQRMLVLRNTLLQSVPPTSEQLMQLPPEAYKNHADMHFIAAEHRRYEQLGLNPSTDQGYAWVLREKQRLLCSGTENPQRIVSHFDAFKKHIEELLTLMGELSKHGSTTATQLHETQSFAEKYLNRAIDECLTQASRCERKNDPKINNSMRGITSARAFLKEILQYTDVNQLEPRKSRNENELINQIDEKLFLQIQERILSLMLIGTGAALFGIVALLRCLEAIAINKELPCHNENCKITADKLRKLIAQAELSDRAKKNVFDRLIAIISQEQQSPVQRLPVIPHNSFSSRFNFFSSAATAPVAPSPTPRVSQVIITANAGRFNKLNAELQAVKNNPFYQQHFKSHLEKRENGTKPSWIDDCIDYFNKIATSTFVAPAMVTLTFVSAFKGFDKAAKTAMLVTKLTADDQKNRTQLLQHLKEIRTHLLIIGRALGINLVPKSDIPPAPK